jgi:hypothetical protein
MQCKDISMTEPSKAAPLAETQNAADDIPVESGKQILLNWITVALGLGGVATIGALLPKLL